MFVAKAWAKIESTIDSEGFKGGTRGAPIMPRDAVSRTANVKTELLTSPYTQGNRDPITFRSNGI